MKTLYTPLPQATILDKVLGTVLQYSHFSVISPILFEIFLQFFLPPPYTKLKLGKNSGYTSPKLFVG